MIMSLKEKLRDIFDKYELEMDFLFIDFEYTINKLYKTIENGDIRSK
jgi:hypothetical protein